MSARDDYPYWPAPDERRFSAEGAWHWSIAMDEIDRLRAAPIAEYPHEFYCPSIDVCAICGDSECDGISCLFGLCPDIDNDRELLEQVQTWVRLGRIQEQANAFLAVVENRS